MKWCGKKMKNKILNIFKNNILVNSKKNRTFANEDTEPCVLAVDVGKPIPTLKGKDARIFLDRMKKVEEEAEKRKDKEPSLEVLKNQFAMEKMFFESELRNIRNRHNRILKLKDKIDKLEKENGKTKEE